MQRDLRSAQGWIFAVEPPWLGPKPRIFDPYEPEAANVSQRIWRLVGAPTHDTEVVAWRYPRLEA